MIHILLKIFPRNPQISHKNKVGIVCSICGIILNIFQFIIKMVVGSLSDSVAISADAVHNLSDMGSSVITLLSFILPLKKYNKTAEFAAGLIISILLFVTAIQTAKSSILKIITPEPLTFSLISVIMLAFSILIKIYMATYYYRYGKLTDSRTLKITSVDCICDSLATIIAAAAIVATKFTHHNADGICGLAVAVFILIAACKTTKDATKDFFTN